MSNQSADSSSKLAVNSSSRNPADLYPTRRDFLLLAGMTGVGASLIRPLNLFADAPASSPKWSLFRPMATRQCRVPRRFWRRS